MSFKPQDPAVAAAVQELKRSVKSHWEDETCGTRYASADDRLAWFDEISRSRRSLEPYIADFANFLSASGKRVLEIGVGAGADFEQWCRVAEHATGVDLTEAAVRLTTERMGLRNIPPERFDLRTADAEALPFPDNSFDIVWSWGVLHHTPRRDTAFAELLLRGASRFSTWIVQSALGCPSATHSSMVKSYAATATTWITDSCLTWRVRTGTPIAEVRSVDVTRPLPRPLRQ